MSYNIPIPLNDSRWQYQTASGGGLTIALVAGSGGSIILRSPQGENVSYRYRYGGVGVGSGWGRIWRAPAAFWHDQYPGQG